VVGERVERREEMADDRRGRGRGEEKNSLNRTFCIFDLDKGGHLTTTNEQEREGRMEVREEGELDRMRWNLGQEEER